MSARRISQRDWTTIVERIHDGLCVPFLGAGVNVSSARYTGLPLGPTVTLRLAENLIAAKKEFERFEDLAEVKLVEEALRTYPELLRLELHNLARVALYLEREVDPKHLRSVLRRILPDRERLPSPLLKTLARLPFRVIITTNYDRLMEDALEQAGRDVHVLVQPVRGFSEMRMADVNAELVACLAEGRLILYKIHGSFTDDGADSDRVIVTEEDYIEFLTVAGSEATGIPPAIRSEIVTSTLLFLGYSLEDWDFRTIFKGTVEKLERDERLKSFAIQRNPSKFWVDFWEASERNVVIYDTDVHGFGRSLRRNYAEHAGG